MELVTIEITGQAITSRYGTLNTGDVLRTDAEYAKHLVEDASCAKYATKNASPSDDGDGTSGEPPASGDAEKADPAATGKRNTPKKK